MKKYTEFIKGNEGFQYSVNLQYDLNESKKIEGYIPTKKSVELLYEYLLRTKVKNSDKSTVLIGPYGKGKSHLLLVLLNILNCKNEEAINGLVEKIEKINKPCADLIKDIKIKDRYLPIVVNLNSMDLNESFLITIKKALKEIGAEDVLPKTYYEAAIDVIKGWKGYGNTYELFKELVKEQCNVSDEIFISQLKSYNNSSFNIFKGIFTKITSGVEFNPLINTDVVKLYEEVNHILNEKYGYKGMIIVFDEFSKFIEASASHNTSRDLKILQDFAELANRSDNPQMHLICVTHKTVNEYISKIPQDKVDAWRAIEGRFTEVYFNSSSQQNYELISNAIIKENNIFDEYWAEHKESFEKYNENAYSLYNDTFSMDEYEKSISKGCFPLSSYATFVLPKISEKVAQNERTLFTFISKLEQNSLLDIVSRNNGEKELITIDNLYDYFEILFKKEVFNEEIHTLYLKADTALNHCTTEGERGFIKALAILYVTKDLNKLAPTKENLRCSLGLEKKDVEKVIRSLRDNNVIMERKSTETIDFMPISGVDVEKKIKAIAQSKMKNADVSSVLNDLMDLKYILPRRYNDEFTMVRYFNRLFMTYDELIAYETSELLLENKKGDGLLINLIIENKDQNVEEFCEKINDNRIILVKPSKKIIIRESISRYLAINALLQDEELIKEDPIVETQLNIYLEDIIEFIKSNINELFSLDKGQAKIKIGSQKSKNFSENRLSEMVSSICYEYYSNAPKINNELINKNNISAPLLKARNGLISGLFNGEYKEFEYDKGSVDCTLFRTTLVNKGLINNDIDEDLNPLLNEIREFLFSAETSEVSFSNLYDSIYKNNSDISARKGIIPIYIAWIFKDYQDEIVVYLDGRKKKEVSLTTEIINNINDNPEKYCLKLERGTVEKEKFVSELEELFKEFKPSKKSENKYMDIVKSIQGWLQSLSKYSKNLEVNINGESIDKRILKFRSAILKFDINNRQFIYEDLLKIFKVENYVDCISEIIKIKKTLESADTNLKNAIIYNTKEIMCKGYEGTLPSALKIWIDSIEEQKVNHLYDITINSVIEACVSRENNEDVLVNKLSLALTGLSIEDWNDDTLGDFLRELKRTKETVENYEVAFDNDSNDGLIKISFIGNDGDSFDKTFDKVEISSYGDMVINNIESVFDEFGGSISDNEKRTILMKMLEKFI